MIAHLALYFLVMSLFIYGVLAYNPRLWLHRMPPAVIGKVETRTKEERKQFIMLGLPLVVWMIGYPIVYSVLFINSGVWANIAVLLAFYLGFNLWDLFVLDLIIFCGITPGFMVIDGTGPDDYKDVVYHLRSGMTGSIISIISSFVIGTVIFWIR